MFFCEFYVIAERYNFCNNNPLSCQDKTAMTARESVLVRFVFIILLMAFIGSEKVSAEDKVVVWKSPTCGCCEAWVTYLEDEGFNVVSHNVENVVPIKNRLGLKDPALYSCHTAVVSGYVIEGHVPAMDIRRLLNDRPDILGLTAPGMPQLSPGMASIIPKNYDVLSFNEAQQAEVYSRY